MRVIVFHRRQLCQHPTPIKQPGYEKFNHEIYEKLITGYVICGETDGLPVHTVGTLFFIFDRMRQGQQTEGTDSTVFFCNISTIHLFKQHINNWVCRTDPAHGIPKDSLVFDADKMDTYGCRANRGYLRIWIITEKK